MDNRLKDIIQDCNLNFLIGSGLSCPFLTTLGNVEILLTELSKKALPSAQEKLIRCSVYKAYFDGVIAKNLEIINSAPAATPVSKLYNDFVRTISTLLLQRKSTILSKQANIFTTNIDVFLEKSLEEVGLEYNDGFNGRFSPRFSLSNFKKSRFMTSLHFDNTSEIPVFNLLKLHGALCWQMNSQEELVFSNTLQHVRDASAAAAAITKHLPVDHASTIDSLITACGASAADASMDNFLKSYDQLLIVNPTKDKFKHSILNQTYYELLRIYSNELEKENTILFVMGFSFADEHIREITLRSARSNPTLIIFIVGYTTTATEDIRKLLGTDTIKNNNIQFISPTNDKGIDSFKYDFANINAKLFRPLLSD
jgi:SIR2-like domain